ncbi:MAG: type I glyceraldehyde-3-phosphate dehydrogenase [Pseudomonadales bacterium]|nr:type I glyceraldehyde-3-phosphate dehydrogenase [Pseudomonadales bacterium]
MPRLNNSATTQPIDPINIAINGFGRIGRNCLRSLYESGHRSHMRVVAINDLGDSDTNAHLLKFDTTHGRFNGAIDVHDTGISVNGDLIKIFSERNPRDLPWGDLNVDLVFECTGLFTSKEKSMPHIDAGAKRVIISAPASGVDATIVYGVNHHILTVDHKIISNASCTTNCLAPLAKPLNDKLGIENGLMTTIHAFTNDQSLTDVYNTDLHRARSAVQSMIPTKTGAAAAVGLVLPELNGKLDGMAVRVPTLNVSLVDLSFIAAQKTTTDEVNRIMFNAAVNDHDDVLLYNRDPLVSSDFNHQPASCVFDSTQTRVNGNLVKVLAWYDNEWAFSNRMLDTGLTLMNTIREVSGNTKNQIDDQHNGKHSAA